MHLRSATTLVATLTAVTSVVAGELGRRQGDPIPGCGGDPAIPKPHLCFSTEYESVLKPSGHTLWYHCIDEKHSCPESGLKAGLCWPLHTNMFPYNARKCYITNFHNIAVGLLVEGYGYKANPKCPMNGDVLCNGDYYTPPIPGQKPAPEPQPHYSSAEIAAMPEPERPRQPGGTPGDSWEIYNPGGYRMHCQVNLESLQNGRGRRHCKIFLNDDNYTLWREFDEPYEEKIGDGVSTGAGSLS